MELIPKEVYEKIPKLYETEEIKDPIVHVKLFIPDNSWVWYITEISIDKDICFCYVVSPFENEMGYSSLEEISELRGNLGLKVERDLSFKPTKLSIIKNQYSQ